MRVIKLYYRKIIAKRWKFKWGISRRGFKLHVLLQATSNNDWIMQVVLMLRPELTPDLKFVPSWLDFFKRASWLPETHFLSSIFCLDNAEDDSKVSKLEVALANTEIIFIKWCFESLATLKNATENLLQN